VSAEGAPKAGLASSSYLHGDSCCEFFVNRLGSVEMADLNHRAGEPVCPW
jgi:hypothetical protein